MQAQLVNQQVEALNPNLTFVSALEKPTTRYGLMVASDPNAQQQLAQAIANTFSAGLVAWDQFYENSTYVTAIFRFKEVNV